MAETLDDYSLERIESIKQITLTPTNDQKPVQPPPTSAPATTSSHGLPMVIPQIRWEHGQGIFGSPFARVYPVELESHGISKTDFLTFLDGFNDTFTTTRTTQSISFAHRVLQLAYGHKVVELDNPHGKPGTGGESQPGQSTSYGKVLLYLQTMNKDVFAPKGLHVSVLRTDEMMHKVGFPQSKLPILARENATGPAEQHAISQRMKPLQGYVSEVDTDVPKAGHSSNLFKTLVEQRNKRQEQARDSRQALRDRHRDIVFKRSATKESALQKKLDKLEAELLERKETAEKKLAADSSNTTASADFDKAKARILRELDRIAKQKPIDEEYFKVATHHAIAEAEHIRWIVITPAIAKRGSVPEMDQDYPVSEDEGHE